MSQNNLDHLVKMANQIVSSIHGATSDERIAKATDHMQKFWSPLMKSKIADYKAGQGLELNPEAKAAVNALIGS